MKRSHLLVAAGLIGLILLLASTVAFTQQPQRINYRVTNYFRVAPEKTAAMVEEARTTERKLMQERMASGENITTWVLLREAYRGIPANTYDYAIAVTFDGAPQTPNTAKRDEVYRKATGMSFQDYTQKLNSLRTNVGSVLYRVEAATPGSQAKDGNYIAVTRWKITAGRGGDYGNYVTNMLLPLNAAAVKEGRSMAWSATRVVSPGGAEAPFNAVISNTVKDLAATMPTAPPASPNQGQVNFTKVFPGQNFADFVEQGQTLRTLVRSELFEVMVAVERQTTTSSAR
jgi:hypothetical protein